MAVRYLRYETPGWRDARAALPLGVAEEIREKFMPPEGCLLLAYDPDAQQKVVGTAGYTKTGPGVCQARRVVVGWEHQRKGIGRGLMEMLMAEARRGGRCIVGMSALLTTTMPVMGRVVEALKKENLKNVRTMVGGAPVTQDFATEIGADGYAPDAADAADLAKKLLAAGA